MKYLFHPDNNLYLTVDLLIDINNIITVLNNIALRKVNAKLHGHGKMFMEKDLIKNKLFEWTDQFN